MKTSTLFLATLPAVNAWTFTWRTSTGDATTERGSGPSECIAVNHAKSQIFAADGQGEDGINMLLFSNDECEGEPAGMATENFVKESSVDLKGFQVVSLEGGNDDEDSEGDEDDQTVTLPTVPATTTLPSTSTGDEDDETFTLPTEPATTSDGEMSTTTDSSETRTTTESPTPTETATNTESETDSTTEPTPTETDSESETETGSGEEEPTPTGAASRFGFSRHGFIGVVVCGLVEGWAVDVLF
ncbi:hypothetical protein BDV06DRAFT_199496 [Aspergillus oleicola]